MTSKPQTIEPRHMDVARAICQARCFRAEIRGATCITGTCRINTIQVELSWIGAAARNVIALEDQK